MTLTDAERDRLAELDIRQGAGRQHHDPDWPADGPISFPWRDGDRRRKVTLERCNAVREAAHDGLRYRKIAELFTFIANKSGAQEHATGSCVHGEGDVPPVGPRDRSPHPNVTAAECAALRRRWRAGEFESCYDAGESIERDQATVSRHLRGECDHPRPDWQQRDIDARLDENRAESLFADGNGAWQGGRS